MQTLPVTLTHAAPLDTDQGKRQTSRRSQSCGSEFESCKLDNDNLYDLTGWTTGKDTVKMLECDEFPWAASEEGGHYRPANERSTRCVPRVQNNYGGQCVGASSPIPRPLSLSR